MLEQGPREVHRSDIALEAGVHILVIFIFSFIGLVIFKQYIAYMDDMIVACFQYAFRCMD